MDIKSILVGGFRSRLVQVGFWLAILGAIQVAIPTVAPFMDPQHSAILNVVLGVVIVALRFGTTGPVGGPK